jgi:HSP20 family molecular chaperone IbpA
VRAQLEGESVFQLVADLPGAIPDDIDLTIAGSVLTLTAMCKRALQSGTSKEESEASFDKCLVHSFQLPKTADMSFASTKLKDGVLTVTIPKLVEPAAKKLHISCE